MDIKQLNTRENKIISESTINLLSLGLAQTMLRKKHKQWGGIKNDNRHNKTSYKK